MSTKHNAMFAYALYLSKATLRHMYTHYFEREIPETTYEMLNDLYEANLIDYESDFTGEVVPLDNYGFPNWGKSIASCDADPIGYWTLRNEPSLLTGAYIIMDDAVQEVRAAMDGLLPDDFDYRGNLCLILGTYYG